MVALRRIWAGFICCKFREAAIRKWLANPDQRLRLMLLSACRNTLRPIFMVPPFSRLLNLTPVKVYQRLIPGWQHLHLSRIRRCRCCDKVFLIEVRDPRGEKQRCLRCGANLRYELLGSVIRRDVSNLKSLTVLELDYRSPLHGLLQLAKVHHRTFYDENEARGRVRADGARCEDITALTFTDQSIDLIVSSEVLEHVPDIDAASREISRVLKPGGVHLFTVPTSDKEASLQRARIEQGQVVHLVRPEYHGDSTTGGGVLAFWTYGRDLPEFMDRYGLRTEVVMEERNRRGELLRLVWRSQRSST